MRRLFIAATAAALFTLAGCSGNSSSDQPATASNANGTSQSASNGSAPANSAKGATTSKGTKSGSPGATTAAPMVIPAGTVLTVRLGETLACWQQQFRVFIVGSPSVRIGLNTRPSLQESPVRVRNVARTRPTSHESFVRQSHDGMAVGVFVGDQKTGGD